MQMAEEICSIVPPSVQTTTPELPTRVDVRCQLVHLRPSRQESQAHGLGHGGREVAAREVRLERVDASASRLELVLGRGFLSMVRLLSQTTQFLRMETSRVY